MSGTPTAWQIPPPVGVYFGAFGSRRTALRGLAGLVEDGTKDLLRKTIDVRSDHVRYRRPNNDHMLASILADWLRYVDRQNKTCLAPQFAPTPGMVAAMRGRLFPLPLRDFGVDHVDEVAACSTSTSAVSLRLRLETHVARWREDLAELAARVEGVR